jgi:rhodanese-related sulfurtransferase
MSGHLANAINIDVEGAQFNSDVAKLDKSKTYAVYCRSGRRSAIATDEMSKLGFKTLFNLEGGTGAWSAAGQTLVVN